MTTPEAKEFIGQAMEGCLDILRRYAPSTTSGNPPIPSAQVIDNVMSTLADVLDTLAEPDEKEVTESDEVPGIVDPGPGFSG